MDGLLRPVSFMSESRMPCKQDAGRYLKRPRLAEQQVFQGVVLGLTYEFPRLGRRRHLGYRGYRCLLVENGSEGEKVVISSRTAMSMTSTR